MKRWLRIGLVVTVGFALSILSTVVAFFVKAVHAPTEADYICGRLIWPGMAITVRWLVPDVLGHPLAALSLSVALNTLIYSGLFGLFLGLSEPLVKHRKSVRRHQNRSFVVDSGIGMVETYLPTMRCPV